MDLILYERGRVKALCLSLDMGSVRWGATCHVTACGPLPVWCCDKVSY